ncbi:MAG: tetratricopeptide repeat protein [Synechococcaceae cyanobacterium RL_1_2]|nr:tetratricopeptide repeat protein [Synechococcaceae cyanobacterium RL_1_2]
MAIANYDLGEWSIAADQVEQALQLISPNNPLLAQLHNTKASLLLAAGNPQQALDQWQRSEQLYGQLGDLQGEIGAKLNQAQSLQAMGFFRQSQQTLDQIYAHVPGDAEPSLKIKLLESLGSTYQLTGNLVRGEELLQEALAIATQEQQTEIQSSILFNLANNYRAQEDPDNALRYYDQAAQLTQNNLLRLEAQVNQLGLRKSQQNWQEVQALEALIQPQLRDVNLNPSRRGVYAQINLAQSLIEINEEKLALHYEPLEIAQLLAQAINNAKNLSDNKLESYGLGTLGYLYEQNQQWQEAEQVTMQALTLAEAMKARDISYQWQWQLGRIYQAQGNIQQAIDSFTLAVNTLQILRTDLVAINSDVRFSFREKVEPVYRGLVSLLLTPSDSNNQLPSKTTTQNKPRFPRIGPFPKAI